VAQLSTLGSIRAFIYEHKQRPNTAAYTRAAGSFGFYRHQARHDTAATSEAAGTLSGDGMVANRADDAFVFSTDAHYESEVFTAIHFLCGHVPLGFDSVSRSRCQSAA
jgi:hypothetical protein